MERMIKTSIYSIFGKTKEHNIISIIILFDTKKQALLVTFLFNSSFGKGLKKQRFKKMQYSKSQIFSDFLPKFLILKK